MGLKTAVVILAVLVAGAAYWLYAPLPEGYSPATRRQFQVMMSVIKIIDTVAKIGSYLGFGTYVEINKNITVKILKLKPSPSQEGIVTSDAVFDGIPVRIYKPEDAGKDTLAGIVYYHGGGWTFGSIDSVDSISRQLCKETRSVVVSVEYRMAPDFPFPASNDDCTVVTKYFLKNAAQYQVNPKRVAVAGDSAGGNLAATVSLRLRDEKFPIPIKLQILIYPVTQGLDFALPSMLQNKDGPLLTRQMMTFFTTMYIEGSQDREDLYLENRHVPKSVRQKLAKTFLNVDRLPKEFLAGYERPEYPEGDEKVWNEIRDKMLDPYYSPLAADNLEGLPEAYVLLANFDPLRDEGFLYADRLREAKNKVTVYNAENGFHGIANFIHLFPEADVVFEEITKFIKANL